jgi:heme oxygenase
LYRGCGLNLELLKSATRAQHEATESLMPELGTGLNLAGYRTLLERLYPVVRGWEEWAWAHAPEGLDGLMDGRRRTGWLAADLTVVGSLSAHDAMPFAEDRIPGLGAGDARYRAAFLGVMYVMEGSTLGGQYIARQVEEALGFVPGIGDAYFRGHGERTGEMWRAFRAVLAEVPEEQSEHVIAAANAMFTVFGDGLNMQRTRVSE